MTLVEYVWTLGDPKVGIIDLGGFRVGMIEPWLILGWVSDWTVETIFMFSTYQH